MYSASPDLRAQGMVVTYIFMYSSDHLSIYPVQKKIATKLLDTNVELISFCKAAPACRMEHTKTSVVFVKYITSKTERPHCFG